MRNQFSREKKTIEAMIRIYCRDHHQTRGRLCPECADLLEYACMRLDKCPHGDQKPVCTQCKVHCYRPAQREKIREIMRYSGPRMMKKHPILAARHLIDSKKNRNG